MELFAVLFALSFWYWIPIFVMAIVITILVESENGVWATVATVVTIGVFCYLLNFHIAAFTLAHPLGILKWIAIWFAAGAGWGTAKWLLEVHRCLGRYQEARDQFLADKGVGALTPQLAVELDARGNYYGSYRNTFNKISATPPKASDHKADIIRWMTYWPFSMIGFVLRDFVRRIWNHIYTYLAATYDRIAKHVYRNVAADADLLKQGQEAKEKVLR